MIGAAVAWLAGSRLGRYAAAALALLVAVLTARAMWRADGARDARQGAENADHERSEGVRERVDAARADDGGDPVERLRAAGRLRD
jgi:hypothetical protein